MTGFKPFIPKERVGYIVGGHCQRLWKILPKIKENIESSPSNMTSISTKDFKKELGPDYKEHSDATIYKIARYGLFEDGINVGQVIEGKDIYLVMRNRKKEDTINVSRAKKEGYLCKGGKRIDP